MLRLAAYFPLHNVTSQAGEIHCSQMQKRLVSILVWSTAAVSPKLHTRDPPFGITAPDLLLCVVDPTNPQPLGKQPPPLWPVQCWHHKGKGADGLVLGLVPATLHWSDTGLES